MNTLARAKLDFHFKFFYPNSLRACALKVKLYAPLLCIIKGTVFEDSQVEISVQLAIDARQ